MKNSQSRIHRWLSVVVITLILPACYETVLTPSETVQHFWSALVSGDVESAQQHATAESKNELLNLSREFEKTSVSFGKITVETNKASIETTLTDNSTTNDPTSTSFNTVLQKQESAWKVNYIETQKSLDDSKRKKGLSKLVDDLGKMGRDVTGQLGGVIKNWEKVTPEIKKDLEELGNSMQKQLQDSIDKHGPEIQKKLQEFTDSLDDALKDIEKGLPDTEKSEDKSEPEGRMI